MKRVTINSSMAPAGDFASKKSAQSIKEANNADGRAIQCMSRSNTTAPDANSAKSARSEVIIAKEAMNDNTK
jgi:hypothetical protein